MEFDQQSLAAICCAVPKANHAQPVEAPGDVRKRALE
jgi:hypothetical protein